MLDIKSLILKTVEPSHILCRIEMDSTKKHLDNITHMQFYITPLLLIIFIELIRTAWICDDSAITIRSVLNFLHGFGPTFNIDERVQSFTHPLWFLLLAFVTGISKNIFFSIFFNSFVFSLLTAWLLIARLSISLWHAVLVSSALIFSKAYLDFSTSGLENSLSHFLIVMCVAMSFQLSEKTSTLKHTVLITLCSLLYLNRADLILLVFPLVIYQCYCFRSNRKALALSILVGLLPLVLWTFFSLFYYGFLFPNTAYAKLGSGIPRDELIHQGFRYFLNSIDQDPLTLSLILMSLILGWKSSVESKMINLGILLYLIYIVFIGGDFMSGRFFTAPFICACCVLARLNFPTQGLRILTSISIILGCLTLQATLLSHSSYNSRTLGMTLNISDERGIYYPDWGLLAAKPYTYQSGDWGQERTRAITILCGLLGFSGLAQGPHVHFIDTCALADPLLSKLSIEYTPQWRIGHFERQLPDGYIESIKQNKNLIRDPQIKAYYDAIRLVTRGKLLDKQRLYTIIKLNLGLISQPKLLNLEQSSHQNHANPALILLQQKNIEAFLPGSRVIDLSS